MLILKMRKRAEISRIEKQRQQLEKNFAMDIDSDNGTDASINRSVN